MKLLLLLVFFSLLTGFEVTFGDENDGILGYRAAENPGAATKPYVTSLKQTKYWALLQCEVRGAFPKPKLHWEDSDENILHAEEPKVTERRGRYDVILQTTVTKTDNYFCVATQEEIKHQIYAETHVFISEPDVINLTVEEGSDVILPCSLISKENIVSKLFVWKKDDQKQVFFYDAGLHTNNDNPGQDEQFKGRISHFDDELKSGNASIIIRNTKVADSGDYTCDFPQLQPRQISHIKLHVDGIFKDRTAENIPGAAPKPYVKTLNQTKNWALLLCEVRDAFPKPKLHWQDSDGNILHSEEPKESVRGDRYDIILNITVTKTDNYRCVATQEEISHQIYAETHVPVLASSAGWIVAAVFGGLFGLGIIVLAVLIWKGYITLHCKKGGGAAGPHNQHEENVQLNTLGDPHNQHEENDPLNTLGEVSC